MREAPETVRPLLVECITHDPRIDGQIEERSDYYARLAILTKLDLTPLDRHLHLNDDPDQTGWNTPLTIGVLGQLAKRRYANSVAILRDYVGYGYWWSSAIEELAETASDEATDGLDEVICYRFSSGQEIWNHNGFHEYYTDAVAKVYIEWRGTNPRFAKLLDEAEANFPKRGEREKLDENLSTSELLSIVDRINYRQVIALLANKVTSDDKDLLLAAFSSDSPFQWIAAFHSLQEIGQAEPAYVPLLDNIKAYFTQPVVRRGRILSATAKAMVALPDEMIHDLVRQWLHAPQSQWWLELIARRILEESATPEDIPMIIAVLTECQREENEYKRAHYRVCSMLDMLARFQHIGPTPEVEIEFDRSAYSYNRLRAAEAMRANAPEYFDGRMAFECLWDCEEEARTLGCETVNLNRPGATERLHELADDPFEEEVCKAARDRLHSPLALPGDLTL